MTHRGRISLKLIAGVFMVVAIGVSVAVPLQREQIRAKESGFKNQLYTLRTVIDRYTFDKQKAPGSLRDLVEAGYLREIPVDPMTGSNQTWRVIRQEGDDRGGISDVRSGSDGRSSDGTTYAEW